MRVRDARAYLEKINKQEQNDACVKELKLAHLLNKRILPLIMESSMLDIKQWPWGVASMYLANMFYIDASGDDMSAIADDLSRAFACSAWHLAVDDSNAFARSSVYDRFEVGSQADERGDEHHAQNGRMRTAQEFSRAQNDRRTEDEEDKSHHDEMRAADRNQIVIAHFSRLRPPLAVKRAVSSILFFKRLIFFVHRLPRALISTSSRRYGSCIRRCM